MFDGSVLIAVYKKDKIVPQTKPHSPHPGKIPIIISIRVEHSLLEDAEDKQQTSAMAEAKLLNLMMQK